MDESQNNQIALKDIIMLLMEKLDAQMGYTRSIQERLDRIEKGVVEGLLNPLAEAQDEFEFNDWKETYGKPLERYEGATKAIEGDDFDIYREAYKGSRQLDDESQGEFIEKLTKNLEEQILALRNGLDLPPNTEVEIKSDSEGDVEVKVDGETVGDNGEVIKDEEVVTESPVVAEKAAENEVAKDFNEKMENPEEEDETLELEKISNKYKDSKWR
jgi:hypothetical protein